MKKLAIILAGVGLILAASGVQPAHGAPVLVPVYGVSLPDHTAAHTADYPFDPSGMETSSFLIGTQLDGYGWAKDARLFEGGLTSTLLTGTQSGNYLPAHPSTTTSSASLNMADPFLQNVQTSGGWTSLARVEATGDDWPGGSDASDTFLMEVIVESGGGTSWQEANALVHARYGITDPGWTQGHIVTLTADFTPDVDWNGADSNRDVRMVFGWALADEIDFYHDWATGPGSNLTDCDSDDNQISDLLTAHYDTIDADDGSARYVSHIHPIAGSIPAVSDTFTLVVDSGETFDINAFLRGHMTITHQSNAPKSNGEILLTVSAVRVPEPATLALMGLGGVFALIRRRRK